MTQLRNIFAIRHLRWLLLTGVCYFFPFAMFTTELMVLTVDKLAWTPEDLGLLLLLVGCIDIVMQGFLSGKLILRFGEVRMVVAGLICEAASYVLVGMIAIVPQPALLIGGIVLFAFGSGLLEPPLNALTSAAAGSHEQGVVQGGNMALRSLTNIVGPLLAGVLYLRFGAETPFWIGAIIMLLGVVTIQLAAQHIHTPHPASEQEPANVPL